MRGQSLFILLLLESFETDHCNGMGFNQNLSTPWLVYWGLVYDKRLGTGSHNPSGTILSHIAVR
jgi:hypothetical protein